MLPNDRDNDQQQYCFQFRIAVDEKEKREYCCYSMSVYGCILTSDIYSVARVISISGLDNILLLPVVGRCQNYLGHFLGTRHGRRPEICRLNFDAIYHSARDMSTSGLGGHIAISACRSSPQSYGDTFFELVTVENLRFAVEISTLSVIVPEM